LGRRRSTLTARASSPIDTSKATDNGGKGLVTNLFERTALCSRDLSLFVLTDIYIHFTSHRACCFKRNKTNAITMYMLQKVVHSGKQHFVTKEITIPPTIRHVTARSLDNDYERPYDLPQLHDGPQLQWSQVQFARPQPFCSLFFAACCSWPQPHDESVPHLHDAPSQVQFARPHPAF